MTKSPMNPRRSRSTSTIGPSSSKLQQLAVSVHVGVLAIIFACLSASCASSQQSEETAVEAVQASEAAETAENSDEDTRTTQADAASADGESNGDRPRSSAVDSGSFASAQGEIERSIQTRSASPASADQSRSESGAADGVEPAEEQVAVDDPNRNLRVVAWPEAASSFTFRALEQASGVFQTAAETLQPWMFVFAMRNGTEAVSGLTVEVPTSTAEASPPSILYLGYTPTPIDVSRASFRSVLRVSQQLGSVDVSELSGQRIYLEFEEPVRAALFVVQASSDGESRMLRIGTIDAVTEPLRAEGYEVVAVHPIDVETFSDSGVVLVPAGESELPSIGEPIDAMEQIHEPSPNRSR